MFEVLLSNSQCIFDEGIFDDLESAIEFAKGRGGTYAVRISGNHVSIPFSCDGENFSYYNGDGWIDISDDDIKEIIG